MDKFETAIKSLIRSSRKAGTVTLAQLNEVLPDDASSPEKIESAMAMIEDAGLEVAESAPKKGKRGAKEADPFESEDGDDAGLAAGVFGGQTERTAQPVEVTPAAVVDVTEKIDDPVRMYLTQMGEIPLLTREEEISLARKIELTRKQFRKEVLSSGFGLASAIEILEDVVRGELAFDRTLKVNQQDPEIGKADLSDRLPGNIETLRRMYSAAKSDFTTLTLNGIKEEDATGIKKRIVARQRKCVLLIEELNLQGKKVRPMIDLLESRLSEMHRLERKLMSYRGAQLKNPVAVELRKRLGDLQVDGLEQLGKLERRINLVRKAYGNYE